MTQTSLSVASATLISRAAAKRIRIARAHIIDEFVRINRAEVAAAYDVSREELIDSLPKVLDNLEEILSHGENQLSAQRDTMIGLEHGRTRAQQPNYQINDIIIEYRILTTVLLRTLREHLKLDYPTEDIIHDAIHRGIANASAEFLRIRSDQEKQLTLTQKALERISNQLNLVTSVIPTHLILFNSQGRFIFVNEAVSKWWKKSKEEFIGKTISEVLGDEAFQSIKGYSERVLKGETVSYEAPFMGPDGKEYHFLNTYIPDYDSQGKVCGFVVSGTNIESFKAQQKQLEEERDLREKFVSTLTHDLRTPLTAAKISAQVILRQPDDENVRKKALKIVDNLDRADQMIRDLLDSSQIKAGQKLRLEKSYRVLNEIIQTTIEELACIHGDRFIFKSELTVSGFWSAEGIRRIIENLCSNAVKYGFPHSPIVIYLSEIQVDEKRSTVLIEVQNQGVPIPEKELATLFDPFRRSRAAEKSLEEGWGLGLTLVRGLTEAHGGWVGVESSQEKGTIFKIYLPNQNQS